MTDLRAYHNDPAVKARYVQRMQAHIAADELVRGVGWESNGKTRGCAVGCTLDKYDHAAFETELGVPEWAARLYDKLHEATSKDYQYKGEPLALAFHTALPVGADLTNVEHQIHIFIQQQNRKRVKGLDIKDDLKTQVLAAIDGVIDVRQKALTLGWDEKAAESAAASAAWSAESAAASAAWSAESARSAARSVARSARSAWSAAWSVAMSAESAAASAAWSVARSAAWSVARSAAMDAIADEFLRLLENSHV